ncbi:MAG: hypothetical protein IIC67_02110 [Thaumarchaeota archaeon]|nr:hypothetical protein [Nitrososphaerota archaeon]
MAWHKDLKKMFQPEEMGEDQLTLSVDGKGFVNVSSSSTKDSEYYTNMIPLQFTGQTDLNQKDIYDGFICKNGDWEPDANAFNYRIEEVKWDNDNACWQGMNPNEDGMTCEVIGNIYENPELLKS